MGSASTGEHKHEDQEKEKATKQQLAWYANWN